MTLAQSLVNTLEANRNEIKRLETKLDTLPVEEKILLLEAECDNIEETLYEIYYEGYV